MMNKPVKQPGYRHAPGWINQIVLTMKVTAVLMLVGCLHLSAASFSQNVTMKAKRKPLSAVLNEVQRQTSFRVVYNDRYLLRANPVTITAENMPFEQFLSKILEGQPLTYSIREKTIIIGLRSGVQSFSPSQQEREITGQITDESGNPLEAVTITNRSNGTTMITDANGNYRIKITGGDVILVFSILGFESEERTVGSLQVINLAMRPSVSDLDEVVVVGYGTIRKSDLTGAVSKMNTERVNDRPATSIEQFIQGQVPGVQITQNTGAPGGGISFLVRGANSLSGSNQPLIVIDGYPVDSDNSSVKASGGSQSGYLNELPDDNALANLNPGDIESVEVLKDASATAIYGSRGANGVVLITTKQGKADRDRVDYSFRYDLGRLPKFMDVLNTRDYINYSNEAYVNNGQDSIYAEAQIPELLKTNINWQDLIYQTSRSQNHQLSISSGKDKTKYALMLGYLGQEGIVKASKFDRGSLRLNLDREISSKFKIALNVSGTISNNKAAMQSSNRTDPSTSIVHGALRSRPLESPFTAEDEIDQSYIGNPLTLITLADDQNRMTTLMANITADYTLAKGLIFRIRGGVNNSDARRNFYHPRGTTLGNLEGGYAYRGDIGSFNYLTEYTLNFNRTIAKKHRFNAVAGYTWQEWKHNSFAINAMNFPSDGLLYYSLSSANSISKPITSTSKWALASYLARINYTFDDRYLLTLTGRADGSTRLAPGNKWQFFPSIAAGWNLHNESFFSESDGFSNAKIRASFGLSGNQSIAVGATQAKLNPTTGIVEQSMKTGFILANLANENLHWETTRQYNVGLDLGGRIWDFTFDAYLKQSHDLLLSLTIPPSNGFGTYNTNVGKVENRGLEFGIGVHDFLKGNLQWNINGNFSLNRNKISDLGQINSFAAPSFNAIGNQSLNIARVGDPIASFFGYRIIGIYQNEAEVENSPADPAVPAPGSFKYADLNNDGRISDEDREIIGNPYPDFIFGLTNDWSYKGFSLSVFLQGSIGQDVINANRYYLDALGRGVQSNVSQAAYDNRWVGEGTSNTYPKASMLADPFGSRFSDFIVEDASFVRVKNVTLSHILRQGIIPGIQSLRVFLSSDNLFTFTNYSGYDPEINSRGDNAQMQGIDSGSIPQYRTFSVGINVGF